MICGRICLQDVSESCHFVWFGDGGPKKKDRKLSWRQSSQDFKWE